MGSQRVDVRIATLVEISLQRIFVVIQEQL